MAEKKAVEAAAKPVKPTKAAAKTDKPTTKAAVAAASTTTKPKAAASATAAKANGETKVKAKTSTKANGDAKQKAVAAAATTKAATTKAKAAPAADKKAAAKAAPANKVATAKSKSKAADKVGKAEEMEEAEADEVKADKADAPAKKRGTKRAQQDLSDLEMEDVATELPDIKSTKKRTTTKSRASVEPSSEAEEGKPIAKRPRRGTTPLAGPLNSLPQPIGAVHTADVTEGNAVKVSSGLLPTSGRGEVLPRKLFVWGSGDSGQFGVGPPEDDKPHKLNKPKPFGNKDISVQIDDGDFGQGGIEAVIGGGMHSVIIDSNGRILTSGADDYGTLGRRHRGSADDAEESYYSFSPVEGISPTGRGIVPGEAGGKEGDVEKYRAVRVASADAVGVVLDERGRLRSWGYFKDGEGRVCFADSDADGFNREQWHPIPLPGIEQEQFAQVACGENHALALTLDGRVYSWGLNTCYQLGRTFNPRKLTEKFTKDEAPKDCHLTPTVITGLGECRRIFCGLSNGFAVEKSGKVVGWGLNTKGQSGTGLKAAKISSPHTIAALGPTRHNGAQVVQIVGGNFHTAFLLSNGQVYICGDSDEGKLGLPSSHPALAGSTAAEPVVVREPVHVPFPDPPSWAPAATKTEEGKTKIVALSAGMRFTLALAADGTLYSWGTTSDDAMGQPSEDAGGDQSKDTPTAIAMPGQAGAWRIMAAATAGQHSLALAVKPPQDED